MGFDAVQLIEEWFRKCDGDGEFVVSTGPDPYTVIGPRTCADRLILTTKTVAVSKAMFGRNAPRHVGLIGRYGLPKMEDLDWIRDVAGSRVLLFLGDLDPVDLLIFAWLSVCLCPNEILHFGVNDLLLKAVGIAPNERMSIPLSARECEARYLLARVFPNLREKVGAECHEVIDGKNKIEVEAVVAACEASDAISKAAISFACT